MKVFAILAVAAILGGCASSGAVLIGPETYLLKKQGGLGTLGLVSPLAADLLDESAAFCLRSGRAAETIKESTTEGVPMIRSAAAELQFRCVAIRS